MNNAHLIDSAELQLDFNSHSQGSDFQAEAAAFINKRLLPMVEQILDQMSPADEVISIDNLEIDLGNINGPDFKAEIEYRLKHQLQAKLSEMLPGRLFNSGGVTSEALQQSLSSPLSFGDGVRVTSKNSSQWQQLQTYLLRGVMPWHFTARDDWLPQAVNSHFESLIKWVASQNHSQGRTVISRLVNQLTGAGSAPVLAKFIGQLSGQQQQHAIELLAKLPPGRRQHSSLKPYNNQLWLQQIADVLMRGRDKLQPGNWSLIVSEQSELLLWALHYYGQQASVRKTIARKFSNNALMDIIMLLEPLEHPFIRQLINQPELFVHPMDVKKATLISSAVNNQNTQQVAGIKTHLWAFTLGYLLVERGSRFNRKSYLASLVKQMAGHHNVAASQMLESLTLALASIGGQSVLKDSLQQMLIELAETPSDSAVVTTTKSNVKNTAYPAPLGGLTDSLDNSQRQIQLQLSQAIIEGSGKIIESQWQQIIRKYSPMLVRLIRYHGKQTSVRKRVVRGFTDSMLTDIVVVLEPVEHVFVRQIIDNGSRIFNLENAPPSDTEKQRRTHLWEFTLGYLLVERGSEFNKKSYLGSLTRQMAAHNNMQYPQLLLSLAQTLQSFEGATALKQQLQQILQVLGEQAGVELGLFKVNSGGKVGEKVGGKVGGKAGVVKGISDQSGKNAQADQDTAYYPDLAKWHPMASGLALDKSSNHTNNHSSNKTSAKLSLQDQQLLRQLVKAIVLGDAKVVAPLWSRLAKSHARLITAILVHYGRLAEVRHQMSIGFTERLLMDVVYLLAPTGQGFIETVMVNQGLFGVTVSIQIDPLLAPQSVDRADEVKIASDAVALKHSLWEFTLAYLLVERGSQFNTKSYLGSLIGQMAAHRNLHYHTLLIAMVQGLATINVVGGLKSELLILLQQLHRQTSPDADKIAAQQQAQEVEAQVMVEAHERYEQIKQQLTQATPTAQFSQSLEYLLIHAPLLLQRLLKSAQFGHIDWHKVASSFAPSQLLQLVSTFLALSQSKHQPIAVLRAENPFIAAMKTQAQTLSTPKTQAVFYALVLKTMAANKVIDFEQLLLQVEGDAGASASTGIVDKNAVKAGMNHPPTKNAVKGGMNHPSAKPSGNTPQACEQLLKTVLNQQKQTSTVVASLSGQQKLELIGAIEHLLTSSPQKLKQLILPLLRSPKTAFELIKLLSEKTLVRLLILLQGAGFTSLQPYAQLITNAAYYYQKGEAGKSAQQLHWQYIVRYLIIEGRVFNPQTFVGGYVSFIAEHLRSGSSSTAHSSAKAQLIDSLLTQIKANVVPAQRDVTDKVIEIIQVKAAEHNPEQQVKKQSKEKSKEQVEKPLEEQEPLLMGESVAVGNAGLVLAAPYIPRLFTMLGLTQAGKFKSADDAVRAIHLLQYMVNETCQSAEFELTLNKLLCGVALGVPIPFEIVMTDKEKSTIDGMLKAIIQHWSGIGNTTVSGLRQTFLQRDGTLMHEQDSWSLNVEPNTFDMLLDQIPWTFKLIKYPWMEEPLHVNWR